MPTFIKVDPRSITLGRGRRNALARVPFEEAIRVSQSGRISLEEGDNPDRVKRLLQQASRTMKIKVRSSWEDESRSALLWKRTGL